MHFLLKLISLVSLDGSATSDKVCGVGRRSAASQASFTACSYPLESDETTVLTDRILVYCYTGMQHASVAFSSQPFQFFQPVQYVQNGYRSSRVIYELRNLLCYNAYTMKYVIL